MTNHARKAAEQIDQPEVLEQLKARVNVMLRERWPTLQIETEVLAALLAIADATAELARRAEWQPIETAPKDGTEFLGYWDNDDMHVVCIRGGLYCRAMDLAVWATPRAWMPLPAPPAAMKE